MSPTRCTPIGVTVLLLMHASSVQAFRVRSRDGIEKSRGSSTASPVLNDLGFPKATTWNGKDFFNPHYFIHHGRNCDAYPKEEQETFGCRLIEYREADPPRWLVGSGHEVHWNLQDWSGGLQYTTYSKPDNSNVSLLFGKQYTMPDFCSRAIISELSTVYSRGRRRTSLASALTNDMSISPDCSKFTPATNPQIEAAVFNPAVSSKACWSFIADYRNVYCLGYHQCATCPDSSDEACHANEQRVQCCKDAYHARIGKITGDNLPEKLEPEITAGAPTGGSSSVFSGASGWRGGSQSGK